MKRECEGINWKDQEDEPSEQASESDCKMKTMRPAASSSRVLSKGARTRSTLLRVTKCCAGQSVSSARHGQQLAAGAGVGARMLSSPKGRSASQAATCFAGLGPDDLPSQADSIVRGTGNAPQVLEAAPKPPSDLEYLQELIAIQQNGPKNIGFFGTRNMGFLHQQLIEILSYAMVLTNNHIFTSGATGTNAAVIRGALRAERPDLLTVVLPQSLSKQPPESQELLKKVETVIEMPDNDDLTLFEASSLCNDDIISRVQQIICFAFHDSKLLLETCAQAKENKKMVTLFYLD